MTATLPDIDETLVLPVPLERAWQLLTSEQTVPRWLGCLDYQARVGHVFYMQPDPARRASGDVDGATHCEILALDAPRCFRFSWYLPGTPKTEVCLTLSADDADRTTVAFKHSGWGQFHPEDMAQIHSALSGGWRSYVLPALAKLAGDAHSG